MEQKLKERIQKQVDSHSLFLFMKGTPQRPMCGFSAGVIQALEQIEASYSSFNVLEDEEIRQGIKEYSDWPTIPQLYCKGEFLGGHDIIIKMFESGELQEKLSLT